MRFNYRRISEYKWGILLEDLQISGGTIIELIFNAITPRKVMGEVIN